MIFELPDMFSDMQYVIRNSSISLWDVLPTNLKTHRDIPPEYKISYDKDCCKRWVRIFMASSPFQNNNITNGRKKKQMKTKTIPISTFLILAIFFSSQGKALTLDDLKKTLGKYCVPTSEVCDSIYEATYTNQKCSCFNDTYFKYYPDERKCKPKCPAGTYIKVQDPIGCPAGSYAAPLTGACPAGFRIVRMVKE